MDIRDFAYIVETEKNFDDAVVSVLKAVEQKGWSLFQSLTAYMRRRLAEDYQEVNAPQVLDSRKLQCRPIASSGGNPVILTAPLLQNRRIPSVSIMKFPPMKSSKTSGNDMCLRIDFKSIAPSFQ